MATSSATHHSITAGRLGEFRAERGSTLIEVLVSAVILVTAVMALMSAIDSASASSATSKARSVAAQLAEQDQERMRGMRFVDLSNYSFTSPPKVVAGASYKVVSDSDWIRDSTGGTESCVNNSKEADYIRIRSTVTSSIVGVKTKPVVIESLVAAPVSAFQTADGTLGVAIKDRSGQPLANVPVTVNGPKLLTDMTNSTGCAVFAYIPTGNYTITLNQAGWLTSTNLAQGTVQDGKVTVVDVQYDRAATITGRFYTRLPGSTVDVAARGWYLSAAKKGSAPVSFAASPAPGPVSQITTGNLFPWAEGYGTYSGNCFDSSTTLSNDPTKSKTDYYDTYPGFVNAAPGQAHTVNVLQPSVKLFVRLNTSTTSTAVYTPVTNAHVVVRSTSTGCTDELPGFTTDANGYVAKAPTTTYDPSLPFGRYKICVDTLNANGRVRSGSVTVNNTDPLGTDAGTLTLPTTTGSVCS